MTGRARFLPFLLLLLSACSGTVRTPPPPEPPAQPIALAVGRVEIEARGRLPEAATFIDRRRSQELAEKAKGYLRRRVRAAGGPGYARLLLSEASLLERRRPTTGGISGWFLREADRVLEATLAARISIHDADGFERAFAEARVTRHRPVLEATSVVERDAIAGRLSRDLLLDLEAALRRAIEENLAPYLSLEAPAGAP